MHSCHREFHTCHFYVPLDQRQRLINQIPLKSVAFVPLPHVSPTQGLQDSKAKAVVYLEMRLPSLINPYAVAMVSYALANENKLRQDILFKFASPGLWLNISYLLLINKTVIYWRCNIEGFP